MTESSSNQLTGWRSAIGWGAALIMAFLWFSAGLWKLSDISGWQLKLTQLLVPIWASLPATMLVAISEVVAAVLLVVPAWRRLGAWLSTALLVVFMVYMGVNYSTLQGEDCSCFPWLERAVGPAFFWSDAAMVAVSLLAAKFAVSTARIKQAAYVTAGVVVFAIGMLGYDRMKPAAGDEVPATITAADQEYALRDDKVFLYFFNPTCLHCLDVGLSMAKLEWKVDFVGIPTQDFDLSSGFVEDTGLQDVLLSPDLDLLKKTFPFEDVPYAAAVENGRVLERFQFFEEPEFSAKLRELGLVE